MEKEYYQTLASEAETKKIKAEREKETAENKLKEVTETLHKVMMENQKMKHENDQLQQRLPRPQKSRLHIPWYNNKVPAKPLLFPYASADEGCYRRHKKGVECIHIVMEHEGKIHQYGLQHTLRKLRKFITD